METVTVARAGMTLDLILWRRFGAAGQGMLEAALDVNPGLAALGPVIPLGTAVILPARTATTTAAETRTVVSLFG